MLTLTVFIKMTLGEMISFLPIPGAVFTLANRALTPAIVEFLKKLGRKNVGVNFDPANMILYDKGEPIEALRTLASWVKQCHLKDANRTKTRGAWGEEVPVGTGQVDWKKFFAVLREIQFAGPCCVEREAGNQRVADIVTARKLVESLS